MDIEFHYYHHHYNFEFFENYLLNGCFLHYYFSQCIVKQRAFKFKYIKTGSLQKTILFKILNMNAHFLKKTMEDSKPHELSLNNDYQTESS